MITEKQVKELNKRVLAILLELEPNLEDFKDELIVGGSVANTIMHLLWGIDLVVNDIDIFTYKEFSRCTSDKTFKKHVIDVYSGVSYTGEFEQSYRYTKGLLEVIPAADSVSVILGRLDLNCVEACLYKGEIHVTPAFLKFLAYKTIQFTTPTNRRSYIRAVRKSEQLGVRFDKEGHLALTSAIGGLFAVRCNSEKYQDFSDEYVSVINNRIVVRVLEAHPIYSIGRDWRFKREFTYGRVSSNIVYANIPYDIYKKYEKLIGIGYDVGMFNGILPHYWNSLLEKVYDWKHMSKEVQEYIIWEYANGLEEIPF